MSDQVNGLNESGEDRRLSAPRNDKGDRGERGRYPALFVANTIDARCARSVSVK